MHESAPSPLHSAIVTAAVVSAFLISACQSMQPTQSMAPQKSLYDRLGGQPAVTAVVDDFVGNVAADNRINGFFAGTDVARLKKTLDNFKVPDKEQGELLAVLGPMKPQIVEQ